MLAGIVDKVHSGLAVDVDANRGGDRSGSLHLYLKLSKKADLLGSHRQCHVLAFTRAEGSSCHWQLASSLLFQLIAPSADRNTYPSREREVSGQVRWDESQ